MLKRPYSSKPKLMPCAMFATFSGLTVNTDICVKTLLHMAFRHSGKLPTHKLPGGVKLGIMNKRHVSHLLNLRVGIVAPTSEQRQTHWKVGTQSFRSKEFSLWQRGYQACKRIAYCDYVILHYLHTRYPRYFTTDAKCVICRHLRTILQPLI